MNVSLCEGNESGVFVTVWLAILDLKTGRGVAANAGHEDSILRRASGKFELIIYDHDTPLATWDDTEYESRPFELHPGDCIFVYTDGVPEARNIFLYETETGEVYGDHPVRYI